MKILHIIDSGGMYGAEVMLLTLATEHIRMGLTPIIASLGEHDIADKTIEVEAVHRGIRVEKFRMKAGPNYIGAAKVVRFARRIGCCLMHSHGYKGNILFGPLPRMVRGMPILTTVHGYTSTGGLSKMRFYEWLDSLALHCMDTIILVNRAMLEQRRLRHLRRADIQVIDNGIPELPENMDGQEPLDPAIVDFCRAGCVIGSVGRYSTEKGYNYLIEALHVLVQAKIDARLVLIGEGYERSSLETLARELGVAERVFLTGYRPEAYRYIPHFSIYVISSLTEGLPITLLEAMRCRVPVVATQVGGIPDVLQQGECGLLVAPASSHLLAQAMKTLLEDNHRAADLAFRARNRFVTHYTSKAMAEKYLSIYKRLTARRSSLSISP